MTQSWKGPSKHYVKRKASNILHREREKTRIRWKKYPLLESLIYNFLEDTHILSNCKIVSLQLIRERKVS